MNYVFDSSSLIYLGKLKILEKLKLLEGKKYIPKSVYEEVVIKGFERGEPETKYIDKLIKDNYFIVENAEDNIGDFFFLSKADKEVIYLAKKLKLTAIIDEAYAKKIALSYGIETHGIMYLLLWLLDKKLITKEEIKKYLDKLISLGFLIS